MIAIEERLRHSASVQPNFTIDVYPGDVLEVLDAAIAERDEMRAKLLDELSDSELQRLQAAAERDAARSERDALREQVAELRDELAECRAERDAATTF